MRRFPAALIAGSAILVALGRSAPVSDSQEALQVTWLTDKRKAFDEAKRTGKPIWTLFR